MENKNQCPICNTKQFSHYLSCKDFTVSGETFNLVKCTTCNFIFTNPIPDENEIGKYYKSETYISHSDTKKGIINKLYHIVRNITLKNKLKLINKISSKGRILDVGCGTGHFIKECKNDGWKVEGTEPDQDARKIAEELTNSEISDSIFSKSEQNAYNIISLWHVLEHIHKLNETIEKIKYLLKDDGKLIIAVPNCESADAKVYKECWAAYDVPRHLYHFSKDAMNKILDKHGFKIIEIKPMIFDSFYVSMMSENYKKGNIINAIISGIKSNMKGKKTINHSSLIYIAEKTKQL